MADAAAPFGPGGIYPGIGPVVMISNADGVALKNYIDANPGKLVTLDPAGTEIDSSALVDGSLANLLAFFSSLGPSTGDALIKPELVAPGGADAYLMLNVFGFMAPGMYVAAQTYDPMGSLYSSNGYAAVDSFNLYSFGTAGTSLASPLVAGAAALVKQKHPDFTPAQIKSALVNSANSKAVTADDFDDPVDVQSVGAGLLDAGAAVNATVVSSPATLSFGAVTKGAVTQQVQLTNTGATSVTLAAAVVPNTTGSGVTPRWTKPASLSTRRVRQA